jgi:hypothetical protein
MPKPTSKTRQELRSCFLNNAIPTEGDFAALINSTLNLADDGVLKLQDQPLALVRQMPLASLPAPLGVLNLFGAPEDEIPSWQLQLIGSSNPGFGLADRTGTTRLILDGTTGNLGIGTSPTDHKLAVAGTLNVAGTFNSVKDPVSSLTNTGQLAIKGNSVQLDFIDTDHPTDWAINVDNGKLSFVRSPENNDLVLDGSGNVGIGTSTPGQRLSVNGEWNNGRESLSTLGSAGQLAIIGKSGASVQTEPSAQLDFIVPGNDNDWAIQNKNGTLTFFRSPWQDFASLSTDANDGLQYSYATFKSHVIRRVFAKSGKKLVKFTSNYGLVTERSLTVIKRHRETVLRILYCDNFHVPALGDHHCRWEVKLAKGIATGQPGKKSLQFEPLIDAGIGSGVKKGPDATNTPGTSIPGSIMGYTTALDPGYWKVEIHVRPTSSFQVEVITGSGTGEVSTYSLEVEEVYLSDSIPSNF